MTRCLLSLVTTLAFYAIHCPGHHSISDHGGEGRPRNSCSRVWGHFISSPGTGLIISSEIIFCQCRFGFSTVAAEYYAHPDRYPPI